MYVHTYTRTPCSNTLFGWTWAASLLLRNAADVSAGLCLSPFIKSCGCWLRSTGRPRMFWYSRKRRNELMSARGVGGYLGIWPGGEDVMDSIKSKHSTSWAKVKQWPQSLASVHGCRSGRKQLLRLCVSVKVKINRNLISKWGPRECSLFKYASILSPEPHGCSKTASLWETPCGHRSNLWKTIIGQLRYAVIRQYSPPSKHLTPLNSGFWGPGKPFPWQQTQYCVFM